MARATRYLEVAGARPTHMLTLTLPPVVWEEVISSEGAEVAVARYRRALARFMDTLRKRLRRGGYTGSWFWWVEFQRRGAPHVHLLVDLGDRLPEADFRAWAEWLTGAWARAWEADPGTFRASTRIEALRFQDLRYARAYAVKPGQKGFPFPAPWGRSWGVAGAWARALREAVRKDYEAASRYVLEADEWTAALADWLSTLPPERAEVAARALRFGEFQAAAFLPRGVLFWSDWGEEDQATLVVALDTIGGYNDTS